MSGFVFPPQYSEMLNLRSNDSFFTSPAALQLYQNHVRKVRCTLHRCYIAASALLLRATTRSCMV